MRYDHARIRVSAEYCDEGLEWRGILSGPGGVGKASKKLAGKVDMQTITLLVLAKTLVLVL